LTDADAPDTAPGMVHVYTGNGKGKTTASLGLCLRAWGHGRNVHVIQFMKGRIDYGELQAARKLEGFTLEQFGRPDFVDRENPDPVDVEWARKALARAKELMGGPGVDLLVLDEVNVASSWGLIDGADVVEALKGRPEGMEVVLTGREAPDAFLELADYVTEMTERKHPFRKGVLAREAVEY